MRKDRGWRETMGKGEGRVEETEEEEKKRKRAERSDRPRSGHWMEQVRRQVASLYFLFFLTDALPVSASCTRVNTLAFPLSSSRTREFVCLCSATSSAGYGSATQHPAVLSHSSRLGVRRTHGTTSVYAVQVNTQFFFFFFRQKNFFVLDRLVLET